VTKQTKKRGWWYSATREQKLAQVRAGIELGMTAQQIAMNCGCLYRNRRDGSRGGLVSHFAEYHGLTFPRKETEKKQFMRDEGIARFLDTPRDLVAGISDWTWTGEDAR